MIYWLIYDITQNTGRRKIASLCLDYGLRRIQNSSFAGELTRKEVAHLLSEIKKLIEEDDSLLVIPSCERCFHAKVVVNSKFDLKKLKTPPFLIVR